MYLLDADTLIGASRLYYSFDLAPGFGSGCRAQRSERMWRPLRQCGEKSPWGRVRWWTGPKGLPDDFWLPHTAASLSCGSALSNWVVHSDRIYTQAAKDEYLGKADLHLVAQAKAADHTVVTMEKSEPNSKKKVKIPDTCLAFGVPCVQPFQVYRTLGMRLT